MTSTAHTRKTLPLLDTSDPGSGGCGCGGCGCGTATSPATTATTVIATTITPSTDQETDMSVPTDSHTRTFAVAGMTCGHCVASVTEELQELPGVAEVNVDLVAGGTSTVTVTSTQPLDDDAVQEAVEEAGYQLA
jgi:copper chaperone